MPRFSLRRFVPVLSAGVAVFIASCGGDNIPQAKPDSGATLEGTIKVGNDQVHFAMVTVRNASGSASGKLDEDVKYKISDVPLGEVQVGVNTSAAMGDYNAAMMKAGAMSGSPEKAGRKKVNVQLINIKEQYFDPEKSGLKTTVNKGPNTFNIELPASAKK
jgi:hypothetical protein